MERIIRVFDTHDEADQADRDFYASLSPQERVDMLLEMVARYRESFGEAGERFERVYRVIELSQS